MPQNALTVVTKVKPAEVDALAALLVEIGDDIKHNPHIPFYDIETLHFASMMILNDDPRYAPLLVAESNFDGDVKAHLADIFTHAQDGLERIYAHCEGFPGAGNLPALQKYLLGHSKPCAAFYVGCPGQTVGSIRNAGNIRQDLETLLDDPGVRALPPTDILGRIRQFLAGKQADAATESTATLDAIAAHSQRNNVLYKAGAILVALVIVLGPFAAIFAHGWHTAWRILAAAPAALLLWFNLVLRAHETADDRAAKADNKPVDTRLFEKEDIFVQNHMTTLTPVKPGAFRRNTLKFVLGLVNTLAKTLFITGNLGGIPTIHFARWVFLDNDERLLFFSNYDGSWASYMGDFIDRANYGLTAIWGNTVGFPSTHFLAFGGARRVTEFKEWTRQHNTFTPIWYSAYPNLTIRNITENIQIREQLARPLAGADAARLLQEF